MAQNYERGVENGKRDATIEMVLEKVEAIDRKLDRLPCDKHTETLGSLKTEVRIHWALLVMVLAGLLAVAWTALKGVTP